MKELFGGIYKKTSIGSIWPYILVFGAGVSLMLLGGYADGRSKGAAEDTGAAAELFAESAPVYEAEDYGDKLEKKLSAVLSNVSGAGRVQVVLTFSDGGEASFAADTTYETTRGADAAGGAITEKTETKHLLITEKDGTTAPVTIKQTEPLAEGALIVAEGGGDAQVKASLTRAAAALLNLPAHKIEILKMNKQ